MDNPYGHGNERDEIKSLQAQLAEREAEIEAHEKREAAYRAFVEAYDDYMIGVDVEHLIQAREKLRSVIDGMD